MDYDIAKIIIVGGMSAISLLLPTLLIAMAVYTREPAEAKAGS
jgi:hypothetical protein